MHLAHRYMEGNKEIPFSVDHVVDSPISIMQHQKRQMN